MPLAISTKSNASGQSWAGGVYAGAQTNAVLVAAPGAGRAIFIDAVYVGNLSALNTVELRDGSGGAAQWVTYCPASAMAQNVELPVPRGLTLNTALCLNTTAAAGHVVYVLYHIETL